MSLFFLHVILIFNICSILEVTKGFSFCGPFFTDAAAFLLVPIYSWNLFFQTLAKLEKYKTSFSTKILAPSSSDSKGNDGEEESGWMANQLTFIPESSGKVNPIALPSRDQIFLLPCFLMCE